MQLGDFALGATIDFKWSTNAADGSSITRGTNGEVRVYIGDGATQTTAGVTDSEDFDGLTGIHHCRIVLSDPAYVAGSECQVVLAGAVVDGKTINAVLAHFSIKRDTAAIALLTNGTFGLAVLQAYLASMSPQIDAIQAAVGDDLVTPIADLPTNAELATALAGADDAVLAQVALVKAKTDALPADPADASDIAAAFSGVNSTLATIAGYLDTEIAAIKARTDLLPADPASQAIIIAATDALSVLSAAIKAKTDSLAFTSGRVHADTKAVAGVVLQQNGSGTQSIGGP